MGRKRISSLVKNGSLVEIPDTKYSKKRKVRALFKCLCGEIKDMIVYDVRSGHSKTCGCSRRGVHQKSGVMIKVGHKKTSEYATWLQMKSRCNNPNNKNWIYYGKRGISVCKEWESFKVFLSDMGQKPSPAYSLERVNNDKGYSKENCKWATLEEQSMNKRNTLRLTLYGITLTAKQWASVLEIPYTRIIVRKSAGWSEEKILTTAKISNLTAQ